MRLVGVSVLGLVFQARSYLALSAADMSASLRLAVFFVAVCVPDSSFDRSFVA